MSFKKGDVVILKSGGPQMTVTGVIGEDSYVDMLKLKGFELGDVSVEYFKDGNIVRDAFRKTSIEIVDDSAFESITI